MIGAALQLLGFTLSQARGGATLEYYFYSSMLWAGAAFVTCLLLVRMSEAPALAGTKAPAITSLLVVSAAIFFSLGLVPRFEVLPLGMALAIVVAVGGRRGHAQPRAPAESRASQRGQAGVRGGGKSTGAMGARVSRPLRSRPAANSSASRFSRCRDFRGAADAHY
jgi:hypothetical protein